MKNISQWKKAIRPGMYCEVVDYKYPYLSGTRKVVRVQGKRFSMETPPVDGESARESWLDFPPARDCSVNGNTLTWLRDWAGENWTEPGRRTVTILMEHSE